MKKTSPKIGDVFEIPLSDGRKAYGQYVFQNNGPIIRIFNYFTSGVEQPSLQKIDTSDLIFPPVHVGLHGAIKQKVWKIIGELPTNDYIYKGFLNHSEVLPMPKDRTDPVKIQSWALWNGEKYIELGEKLPKQYDDYESGAIYPPDMIVERIETGFDMFEYPKKYNRFLTEEEVKKKLHSN